VTREQRHTRTVTQTHRPVRSRARGMHILEVHTPQPWRIAWVGRQTASLQRRARRTRSAVEARNAFTMLSANWRAQRKSGRCVRRSAPPSLASVHTPERLHCSPYPTLRCCLHPSLAPLHRLEELLARHGVLT